MSRYRTYLVNLVDERIRKHQSRDSAVGTLVSISGGYAQVVMDGDSLPMPCKYLDGSTLPPDGRVVLHRYGTDWTVTGAFSLGAWAEFTPTWFSTGAQPSLGDGSIVGRRTAVGRTVFVAMRLTFGASTTPGSGDWGFGGWSAPDRHLTSVTLPASCFDASTAQVYPATAQLNSNDGGGTSVLRIGAHSATGAIGRVGGAHPFAWAAGDVFVIQGFYQAA